MPPLSGLSVIITGASAGIGAAVARALAPHRTRLVLAARRADRLTALAAECQHAGAEAVALPADVSRREEVERLVQTAVDCFGRLDVMLANAGFGFVAKVEDVTDQQFDEIMAVNVKGTLYCMQAAVKVMRQQKAGHIIAVSSGAARRGLPLYGVYSATKAAQLSLAEALRVELRGTGIRVSTVHPFTTATEFFDVASSRSRLRSTGLNHAMPVETVARKILGLIRRPRPELWPNLAGSELLSLVTLFPRLGDTVMAKTVAKRSR